MAIARKIAYNAVISTIAKIISTILALVGIGMITRYLGVEGFGKYATILAFFGFFIALADLGLYSVATREISRKNADAKKVMGAIFSLRVIVSTIVAVLSPLLLIFLPYENDVKLGIFLVSISFVFASSYGLLNGIFQKNLIMDRVALTELCGKVIQVSVIYYAMQADKGLTMIIMALLLSMLFNFIVLFILSRRYVPFVLHIDIPYWRKFLRLSLPMGVATFVTFLYIKMDTIILSIVGTQEEVGIYNAAYKIVDTLAFFPAMIIGLMLPLLSLFIFSDRKKFARIADKTMKVFILMVVPIIIATLFMADFIMLVIGGGAFEDSVVVLRILIFASALIFFGHFYNNVLLAGNQQKRLMIALIIAAILNVTANIIFIPHFSYMASAIISVGTELFVVTAGAILSYQYLQYKPRLSFLWRIFIAGGFMIVAFILARDLHALIAGCIAVIVYLLCIIMFRAVSRKELMSIFLRREDV